LCSLQYEIIRANGSICTYRGYSDFDLFFQIWTGSRILMFAAAPFSRTNAIPLASQYGLFLTCKKIKRGFDMYIRRYTFIWLFHCICVAECTWAASVLLVLMRIVPSCLHVYSRWLTTLSYSVDVLFMDAFTFFPWSLLGLADLDAWSKVPSSPMRTYTVISIISSMTR
jgi:hypothetical protein